MNSTEQIPPTPGGRLAAARQARGWSQPELSRQAFGTDKRQSSIAAWERDVYTPSRPNARLLATALGVKVSWLLDGEDG